MFCSDTGSPCFLRFFALKGLSKGHLVREEMEDSAIAEKQILMILDSPMVVRLFNTYKDDQNLFFLMEACVAGDLYFMLNRNELYGDVTCTQASLRSAFKKEGNMFLYT